ncbi:unnamed protein product [Protopolystoma xenopodis]|uniref:PLAT domain-containing protein n=1 Tax=Protopolystoma xenopodis TaxID=117903 RepID=A0A448XNB5_9PLAT|nr:unnamed protein product [Protopolystoma xenopodis]
MMDESSVPMDRVPYELEVVTGDKPGAGTVHNVWIILEGENGVSSRPFVMVNSPTNAVFKRGKTDTFKMPSNPVGGLRLIYIGALERQNVSRAELESEQSMERIEAGGTLGSPSAKSLATPTDLEKGGPTTTASARARFWYCHQVVVVEPMTRRRYRFFVDKWLPVLADLDKRAGAQVASSEVKEDSAKEMVAKLRSEYFLARH